MAEEDDIKGLLTDLPDEIGGIVDFGNDESEEEEQAELNQKELEDELGRALEDTENAKTARLAELMGDGGGGAYKHFGKKKKKGTRKKKKTLTPSQEKRMEEGNNMYIDGRFEEAKTLLLGLIKEAPRAPQPYLTLGTAYEDNGDIKKALALYLLSAFIENTKDGARWCYLADLSEEAGDYGQLLYCMNRVIRIEPKSAEARLRLANVHVELGDMQRAINTLAAYTNKNPGCVPLVHRAAELCYGEKQEQRAVVVIQEHVVDFKKRQKEAEEKAA